MSNSPIKVLTIMNSDYMFFLFVKQQIGKCKVGTSMNLSNYIAKQETIMKRGQMTFSPH